MEKEKVIIDLSEYERLKTVEKEYGKSDINSLKIAYEKSQKRLDYFTKECARCQNTLYELNGELAQTKTLLSEAMDNLEQTKDILQHEQKINSKIKSKLKSNILLRFMFGFNKNYNKVQNKKNLPYKGFITWHG